MSFKMQRVHVYYAEVEDKPGGIAANESIHRSRYVARTSA